MARALHSHHRFRYNCSVMTPDLLPAEDPRDARLAALKAQIADLRAQVAARDRRIADLEAQLAAARRAGHRQATPFARRERKTDPQKPGRKKGQGHFAARA